MTQIDLSNKNILITGASNGIGKAIAEYLIQMSAKDANLYHSNYDNAK